MHQFVVTSWWRKVRNVTVASMENVKTNAVFLLLSLADVNLPSPAA